MRDALVALLLADARNDPDLVFLTGDLGFSVVEPLRDLLGDRFINVGVAEANMMSMAGALAADGFHVYAYSIAPFITLRCLEQVRNDVCYGNRPVRLIGIGAGYSYGALGPSHHSLEDAAIMAQLPNMRVVSPATASELAAAHRALAAWDGPIYYRIPRENGPDLPCADFASNQSTISYRAGKDGSLVASGPVLPVAIKAAQMLESAGIDVSVISIPILSPFPRDALEKLLPPGPVATVFEGYVANPLEVGTMAALLAHPRPSMVQINAGHRFAHVVGGTEFLRREVGLTPERVADEMKKLIAEESKRMMK